MKKLMIGAGLAALLATPGFAQPAAPAKPRPPVTRADVQSRVQTMFAKFDANRDGAVTQAEFDARRTAMKSERQAKRTERRGERFAQLDTNRDGQLSREEFAAARPGANDGQRGRGGHRFGMRGGMQGGWFARLDANKDGRVTFAEASALPLQRFDRVDANKDGTISPEERKAARESFRAEWKAKRG